MMFISLVLILLEGDTEKESTEIWNWDKHQHAVE